MCLAKAPTTIRTSWGWAGPGIGKLINQEMGIAPDSNGVVSPVVREDAGERENDDKLCGAESP